MNRPGQHRYLRQNGMRRLTKMITKKGDGAYKRKIPPITWPGSSIAASSACRKSAGTGAASRSGSAFFRVHDGPPKHIRRSLRREPGASTWSACWRELLIGRDGERFKVQTSSSSWGSARCQSLAFAEQYYFKIEYMAWPEPDPRT